MEILCHPISIETANGVVQIHRACRVWIVELDVSVKAYLHEDTVCVLSLGLLVNCSGFTYFWEPGQIPELSKGKFKVPCHPQYNVPFIYPSKAQAESSDTSPKKFEKVVEEEMKGMEDLIPEGVQPLHDDDDDANSVPPLVDDAESEREPEIVVPTPPGRKPARG